MKSNSTKSYGSRVGIVVAVVLFLVASSGILPWDVKAGNAYGKTASGDLDRDGDIDIDDLALFSKKWLGVDWTEIDWCDWIEQNGKNQKHLGGLYEFIVDYFDCDYVEPPYNPLALRNSNNYPVRVACGPDNKFYVTDFKHGSVFIYDPISVNPELNPVGELKGLQKPLGIAVGQDGNIYVGSGGNHRVEVYDSAGTKIRDIGQGIIQKPNDIVLEDNVLYIVDSTSETVWKYDTNGTALGSIGTGGDGQSQLKFPVAATIGYSLDLQTEELISELYVADQGHFTVKVYDLQGTFIRSVGNAAYTAGGGWMGMGKTLYWRGLFGKVQDLAFDNYGRLNTLDSQLGKAQILDPIDGEYIDYYGGQGELEGEMKLPLGFAIDDYGNVVLANFDNRRVELIYTIP